jgi:hypothetical protein
MRERLIKLLNAKREMLKNIESHSTNTKSIEDEIFDILYLLDCNLSRKSIDNVINTSRSLPILNIILERRLIKN